MIDSAAARLLLRLALCAAVSWAVWRVGGLVPMVATAPLWGVALARPLLDLASDARHLARACVWKPLEGRHFAFRGVPVQVLEDADHRRWIRAADIRRLVDSTVSDAALARAHGEGWRLLGTPPMPHFSEDALLAHLARHGAPEAVRLRRWVEREIAFPARRVRTRLGIRTAPSAPPAPPAVE